MGLKAWERTFSCIDGCQLFIWTRFYIPLDTLLINLETIFTANVLTGTKHSAFSTDHLANIDKTKQNYNLEQQKNPTTMKENHQHTH